MGAGIFNLVIGALAIVGSFNGYALIGTNSTTALGVVGGVIAALGVFQIIRSRTGTRRQPPPPEG